MRKNLGRTYAVFEQLGALDLILLEDDQEAKAIPRSKSIKQKERDKGPNLQEERQGVTAQSQNQSQKRAEESIPNPVLAHPYLFLLIDHPNLLTHTLLNQPY
jgi:hypothetical protein